MNDRTAGELAQVTALDEERRRYEAWLAQLDTRRGSAPAHVLERVRVDYEGRLRDVLARLAEFAELLRLLVDERAQEVNELRDAERQRQDERAEAELRALVGEYTPEQWRDIAGRSDAALDELASRRAVAAAELARLEEVHALAATGGAPPAVAADLADAPLVTPAAGVEPVRTSGASAAHGPPPPPGPSDAFSSWQDDEEPAPLADVAPRPDAGAGAGTGRGERAWLTSDEAAAGAHVPAASAHASASSGRSGAPSEAGGAPAKTLRCSECGTMNYPTEWYCERCGGELAAL